VIKLVVIGSAVENGVLQHADFKLLVSISIILTKGSNNKHFLNCDWSILTAEGCDWPIPGRLHESATHPSHVTFSVFGVKHELSKHTYTYINTNQTLGSSFIALSYKVIKSHEMFYLVGLESGIPHIQIENITTE